MKIEFEGEHNFIELKVEEGGISIILSSKDSTTTNTTIVNSVKLTNEEFKELISEWYVS